MGKADDIRALIVTGYGLNCERETARALELAGLMPVQLHLNDLLAEPEKLFEHRLLAFIGGFSFGDHLGAGTVFANRLRNRLRDQLDRFLDGDNLVIGICNGFQTMTRLGLLPALDGARFEPQVALTTNDQGVFRDAWVTLRANPDSPCVFTRGIDMLPLPIRHGEGKFVARDAATLDAIETGNLVALRYVDPESGQPTDEFPHNPNGSHNAIAGLCDASGRVFGMMPHPEAYLTPYNHPHWQRQRINGVLPEKGLGLQLFVNAAEYLGAAVPA